ncbi:small integral membrane protein 8-like [Mytilus californianus]|uniref:small integral membrane protein 8-like n=1 Tax=Mytilus californianus TaxID=6549 RepID=UPI002245CCA5|nr:small integral membrane protein 8-like [Mytilus californianus]
MGTDVSKDAKTSKEPQGLGSLRTTSFFRVVNFELFAKQNKFTMSMGTVMLIGCISYIVYMNVTDSKKKKSYVAINPDGTLESRVRTSKWD